MANLVGNVNRLSGAMLSTQANCHPAVFSYERNMLPTAGSLLVTPITDPVPAITTRKDSGLVPRAVQASQALAYSDDYYHRVRFVPKSPQSLGFVSSDVAADFHVWYAYLYPGTLTNITEGNAEGLVLGGGVGAGSDFQTLEYALYSLDAAPDGPPDINAHYYFEVDSVIASLNILGSRIAAMLYAPRWTSAVTETLKFLSKALIDSDGGAQTFDVTHTPRRAFSYKSFLLGAQSTLFENRTWGAHQRPSAFPIGSDMTYLQGDLPLGSLTMTLSGVSDRNFYAGGNLFMGDPSANELLEIGTIAGDVITLARPTTVAWPNRSIATPACVGKLSNSTKLSRLTPRHQELDVSFAINPDGADANLPTVAAGLTFEGFEVYAKEPTWDLKGLPHSIVSNTVTEDLGMGRVTYDTVRPHADLTKSYDWLLIGRQDITDFRAFLGRTKGVSNPVIIPTWAHDFTLTTAIANLDGGITVANDSDFIKLVGVTTGRSVVVVHSRTYGMLPFRISSTQDNGDGTITLFFTTQFQNDISIGDVILCCFAPISLMSNTVTFSWLSPDVAIASASFTSVNL